MNDRPALHDSSQLACWRLPGLWSRSTSRAPSTSFCLGEVSILGFMSSRFPDPIFSASPLSFFPPHLTVLRGARSSRLRLLCSRGSIQGTQHRECPHHGHDWLQQPVSFFPVHSSLICFFLHCKFRIPLVPPASLLPRSYFG